MSTYRININGKQFTVKGDMETESGRQKIYKALNINPKEKPVITNNGFTYTFGSKPKAVIGSETLKDQKVNTKKGIDMYEGRNRSERYDKASAQMGNDWFLHPQDFIQHGYFDSKTHKAVKEGGNIAAAIAAAPVVAYGIAEAAPTIWSGMKVAGQAMTPSTWINGIGQAAGYNLDKAGTVADLLLSAYFANEAGKEIDRNGLTLKTIGNAIMSAFPLTKEVEAANAVAAGVKSLPNTLVNDFKTIRSALSSKATNLGREFNNSIKNTYFVNVPIEHVSNNGVTLGSNLNAASDWDVGFHFSPRWSPTTSNIQEATNAPFVRTGTWTYTNNTKPVFVIDKGNWTYDFNPEIYKGLNPGNTPTENALALTQRNPNYVYTNVFEGKGNTSYMTTEPSFGVQLSKNIQSKPKRRFNFQKGLGINIPLNSKTGGVYISRSPIILKTELGGYTMFDNNYSELGTGGIKLSQDAVNNFIIPSINQLRDYYNSGFYARRLAKAGLLSERNQILKQKNINLNNTIYGINTNENIGKAYAWTGFDDELLHPIPILEYNVDDNFVPISFATIHEGSHASSLSLPKIREHNMAILQNAWDNVKPEVKDLPEVKKYMDYILDVEKKDIQNPNALVSEIGGQLQNAFLHMQKNNLTPEQLLKDDDYISRDPELRNAIFVFKPEYLKKLLAPGGIISSFLLTINNNDSN